MKAAEDKKRWVYILVGVLTAIVVLAFARLSFGVVLPFMRDGLMFTYKEAGLLGTITSLGYLGTVFFAGFIASRFGAKNTILAGISFVIIGFVGLSFTRTYGFSVAYMLLLGIGTALTYTNLISLLTAWFPDIRGFVIGTVTSGAGIGMFLTGMVVPYLNRVYPKDGWRITWVFFAAVGMSVFILTVIFIRNHPSFTPSVVRLAKTSYREIYSNRNVVILGVIYGIVGLSYIVQSLFCMSFMLSSGIGANLAGHIVAFNGVLSIFSGPTWGFISDRIGRRFSLSFTTGLAIFGTVFPTLCPTEWGFGCQAIILGCVMSGVFTLIQAGSMDHVQPKSVPVALSYVTFFFASGQLMGPAIAGWLIEDFGGFKVAFYFTTFCLLAAFFLTIIVKDPKRTKILLAV